MVNVLVLEIVISALLTLFASEKRLKGRRLQSSINRVFPVFMGAALLSFIFAFIIHQSYLLVIAMFWSGLFLTWFGTRSHLESSILIGMLVALRNEKLSENSLVDVYLSQYGAQDRLTELRETGVLEQNSMDVVLTNKGRSMIKIINFLGRK